MAVYSFDLQQMRQHLWMVKTYKMHMLIYTVWNAIVALYGTYYIIRWYTLILAYIETEFVWSQRIFVYLQIYSHTFEMNMYDCKCKCILSEPICIRSNLSQMQMYTFRTHLFRSKYISMLTGCIRMLLKCIPIPLKYINILSKSICTLYKL